MLDGASTNRTFIGMLFNGPSAYSALMFHDICNRENQICAIQDIMQCIKKLRNNMEWRKADHKAAPEAFNFNCQSGFTPPLKKNIWILRLHPKSKTNLPKLCWIELYHMRAYQQPMKKSENLASSILLLEYTSMLVDIFCTKKRHISELTDGRLQQLQTASQFFLSQKCGRISPPRNK